MAKSKATVDFENEQAIAVFRELASHQNQSFDENDMASRIGITPYNMIRRASRFAEKLNGWAERLEIIDVVRWRDWSGMECAAEKKITIWRLCAAHKGKKRSQLMCELKAVLA